jgi:hypothetical protein
MVGHHERRERSADEIRRLARAEIRDDQSR